MKKWMFVAGIGIVVACGATKILEPTEKDMLRAKPNFPETTLADLQAGKNIYQQHCGGCHEHKKITKFSETEWRTITPKMVVKTNKKFQNVINPAGEAQLLQYLVTMSGS